MRKTMKAAVVACTCMLMALAAMAQVDVTSQLLTNAGFDDTSCFTKVGVHTYSKDITGSNVAHMQPVNGWTIVENGDARASATFAYGSGLFVGGSGYTAPATNPQGTSTGGALGLVSVWTASLQYLQPVTLAAGSYTLSFVLRNVGGTGSAVKNLFGFVEEGGAEHYATPLTWSTGSWLTQTVSFTLVQDTKGFVSLGYTAANIGSGSMPHLFIDAVSITYTEPADDGPADMTSYIVNPSFESGTTSWTLTKTVSGWEDFKITTAAPSDGQSVYNLWAGNITSLDLSQTLTLPAGNYHLTADLRVSASSDVTTQTIYATAGGLTTRSTDPITAIASPWETEAGWNTLGVDFDVLYNGSKVIVGAASTGDGSSAAGWFQIDNFRLYYLGCDIDVPDISLPDGDQTLLFSESDGSLGESFTVALHQARFASATQSVTLLLRNTYTRGAIVTLQAPDTDVHDWRIGLTPTLATIWCDGVSVGTTPVNALPPLTTGGEKSEITLIGADALTAYSAELISPDQCIVPGTWDTDAYGKPIRTLLRLYHTTLRLSEPTDLWVPSSAAALVSGVIDLAHDEAWIITPHWKPSEAISRLLPSVTISGSKATNKSNARVAIYLDGAAVIPQTDSYKPFRGYTDTDFKGREVILGLGKNNALGKDANCLRSFVLKRGYMATLATNSDGSGYSRVFVADHHDIVVDVMPEALDRRVSSVVIRKWNWVSKKGWASTGGADRSGTVRANWFYSWSASYTSTTDQEYVPEKTHLYWPSWSEINEKDNITAVFSLNEPEHSEQHTSDRCTCGGTISEWDAFDKLHTGFFESGLRIGSPAPTDANYLTNYITYCNNYAYRCDFVVTHAYWKGSISDWKSRLEAIHKATGRPIWLTELEYGASWDTPGYTDVTSAAEKYRQIFDLLEELDYVERFVPYQDDLWYNAMIYQDGSLTPAGILFRDYASSHAYKAEQQFIPVWWKPSVKDVTLTAPTGSDAAIDAVTFGTTNPNGDVTDQFIIQYQESDGTWSDVYAETDRSLFDTSSHSVTIDVTAIPSGMATFRLKVTTITGGEEISDPVSVDVVNANDLAALITRAESAIPTASIGTEPFYYSQHLVDDFRTAITTAQQALAGSSDSQAAAAATLRAATDAFRTAIVHLNVPAADDRYALILRADGWSYDGRAVTYLAGARSDAGGYNMQYYALPSAAFAQAFRFTPAVGSVNGYYLSQVDNEGQERYICTGTIYGGNDAQLRTTTDITQALLIEVHTTEKEGIWKLWNTAASAYIGSQDAGFYTVDSHTDFALQAAPQASVTLTFAKGGWGTLIAPFDVDLPAGATAYTVDALEDDGETLHLTALGSSVPMNTPVLVQGKGSDTAISDYGHATATSYTTGLLTGAYVPLAVPQGSYVLQQHANETAFYYVNDDNATLPVGRCYLSVPATASNALRLGGDATAIIDLQSDVLSPSSPVLFDLQGRRVEQPTHGLYLINGKKMLVY